MEIFSPVLQEMEKTFAPGPDMAGDMVMADAHAPIPGLSTIPPEIVELILDFLIPQPPEIGETRPVAYGQLIPAEPWFDFTRCRRGLRSLCLVSRRLSEMARPLLYRNAVILDETALLLFFRTLCTNPHYGRWSRYLSCHLTLSSNSVIREVRELLPKYLPTITPAPGTGALLTATRHFLQMLSQLFPKMVLSEGDFDHVPQALLCFTLMFLDKVETVLLQVPISDDQPEYDVLCAQIEGVKDLFRKEPQTVPFQSIRTLMLQGDPELLAQIEDDECECDVPDGWGAQPRRYSSLFASFPNVMTLEVSSDDGVWNLDLEHHPLMFLIDDSPPEPFMPNIRHIYLHNSVAYPGDLHHLLRNAPQLETLYMAPRGDKSLKQVVDNTAGEHPDSLNIALAEHAKSLRNLDVSWEDIWGFEALVGPEGRLTSIAEMGSLRTLCVQLALLYGKPSAVLETPLVDMLPPNLVELALEDWWWSNLQLLEELPTWDTEAKVRHYQSQHLYRTAALRILTEFARDVRTRLRHLKKMVLLVKIPWTWVLEDAVSLDFHFEVVKSVFLGQGVEFSVKCDEV
ncbi:hypothetical protein C7999DRAFT_43778 [Corynascus novoguineensis]|uniref:F-box domain-containing protein n=1 Tax=Corynascus novoguineensis TaxID=1126955 RepID=A0AAN7CM39_9PEZI|nr:hypothetical protein C7999DRAFT_43778 [Corynascus novoguineensis]